MANVFATRTGVWSATATWNTSALPATIDDVFSNNFTVYVDNSFQVRTVTNLSAVNITAGGFFVLNNTVTLSANVIGGGTNAVACVQFLSAAPATATLVGSLCAVNTTIQSPRALIHNGTGTLTVIGNGLGRIKGTGNPADGYIQNQSTGTLNLFGNYIAGLNVIVDNRGIWNASFGTINLVGSLSGGVGGEGLYNASTGTVNITGNVFGGVGGSGGTVTGASNISSGTINVLGNLVGTNSLGGNNNSTGTFNVTGNCIGGTATNSHGANNSNFGTFNIRGLVVGGSGSTAYGIINSSSGVVNIVGNAIAGTGTTAYGAINNATGYLEVNGLAIGNAFGLGSAGINSTPGIFGSQTGTTIIRGLSCGARGQWPTAGVIRIQPQSTSTASFETSAFQDVVLFTSLSTNIVPLVSSVRLGTVYNLGDYRGTCAIPSISSVLQGVAIDNSVGIAALQPQTIWNYSVLSATDVNSLGGRLKEVATVQSVGQQLTALN